MVTFGPVLDAPQQAERRVSSKVVVKLYVVEVLHSDPAEDSPRLLHVAGASPDKLPDQIREGFLVFLCHLELRNVFKVFLFYIRPNLLK